MKNLYTQQQEARKNEFAKSINKSGKTPFMLFPIRLETRFRTAEYKKNDAILDYNDYIAALEEISNLQEEIIAKTDSDEEADLVGRYFYQKLHRIQKKIEQIDILPIILKKDLHKLIRQTFSSGNLRRIKTNESFYHKIRNKANVITNRVARITFSGNLLPRRAEGLIQDLKKIEKDLVIISDFDRTSYRAISQLSKLKLPLESIVDREDVSISNLRVVLKDESKNNGEKCYLNIGKRQFPLDSKKASFSSKSNTYTFTIPTADFILDDLVNSMIYLSLDANKQWRPQSVKVYFTGKNKEVLHLNKTGIKWPRYRDSKDEVIKLQKESGANPRLRKYLYKKIHTLPTKMQAAFNQLYVGVPLSLQEKQEIDNLVDSIILHTSQVRANISSIYNPKHLEATPKKHGRRPYVNVPERIKKLAKSVDGVKEYLELHQEALTVFYDVHCDKYIQRTAKIGKELQQKKLTEKYVSVDDIEPTALIIEMIRINKYFGAIQKGLKIIDTQTLSFALKNSPLHTVSTVVFPNSPIVFKTEEEYQLLNKQLKTLKERWRKLLNVEQGKMLMEYGRWIKNLPYSFPKRITDTGAISNKQLCVRIFPDDIFIAQFRKPLSREEYADAKNFHILWFIFSGNRILERSLWDSLVAKYDVHRASWLVRVFSNLMKANIEKRPYNNFADSYLDEIENILKQLNKREKNRDAIIELLEVCSTSLYNMRNKVYDYESIPDVLHDQIQSKIERVKQSFYFYERLYEIDDPRLKEVDPQKMELWDKDYYAVLNFKSELEDFLFHLKDKRADLEGIRDDFKEKYFKDSYFKTKDGKSGYNDLLEINDDDLEPHSPILPDRFVVIGEWTDGKNTRKITEYGRKVNPNLQLSFSDKDEEELDPYLLNVAKGDVEVEGGLKWLFDYDEAVRNGMAITVPLSDKAYDATFKSIYVFGVKDTYRGKETLEDLLRAHIYTDNSLDFLEIGTPTNQLESNRNHYKYLTEQAQTDRRYEIEVARYSNKNISVGTAAKSLASTLGLSDNDSELSYLNSADLNKPALSKENVKAFLPNTANIPYGQFRKFIKYLPEYVSSYVYPRGYLPTLRVGDMPYGIMPTTDFSELSFSNDKTHIKNLYKLLNNLSVHWDNMFNEKVEAIDRLQNKKDEDSQVRFMRMMSTNPHSVSYRGLEMIKHPLLARQFHFFGNYKNLNEESLASYSEMFTAELVKKLDYFTHFPTGKMTKDIIDVDSKTDLRDLIDLFSYHIDAWFLSLANYQLKENNAKNVHIGAYGWLFNLKREKGQNSRVKLPQSEQKKVVEDLQLKDTTSPIYEDRNSEGVMLAPSINHAVTAAVMHSAYARSKKNNSKSNQQDNRLSINLSSGRMQRSMQVIDGISNGLSLGAILGAHLERGLHEAYKISKVEMDEFIFPLRQKYPLNVDSYTLSASDNNYQLQGLNGARLLEDVFEKTRWYDSKDIKTLAEAIIKNYDNKIGETKFVGKKKKVFANLVEQIADTYDAVNDLILSEGVYQLVKGNRTALSGLMNKMEHNSLIARPEILDIPMRSVNISHRLVVNFKTCTANQKPKGWTHNAVFSLAEPSLNYFVGNLLGNGNNIGIWVKIENSKATFASLDDLQVTPLEYLYFSSNRFAFVEMLLARYRIIEDYWLPTLEQVEAPTNKGEHICISEQTLFVESLRKMVQSSMQLKASHFVHQSKQNEPADQVQYYDIQELLDRLEIIINKVTKVQLSLEAKLLELKSVLATKNSDSKIKDSLSVLLEKNVVDNISESQFKELTHLFTEAYTCGVVESVPPTEVVLTRTIIDNNEAFDKDKLKQKETQAKVEQNLFNTKKAIVEQALNVLQSLDNKLQQKEEIKAMKELTKEKNSATFDVLEFIKRVNQIAEKLLIKNFKLLPKLRLHKLDADAKEQLRLQLDTKYTNTSPHKMEDWVMDLAKVRKYVKDLHSVRMNAMFSAVEPIQPLVPVQLPFSGDTEWAGMEFSDEEKLEDKEATVLWNATALQDSLHDESCAGFVVDNWIELIPKRRQNAGAVFHYDVPNAEPPQTILLAVSPSKRGYWTQNKLINILDETKRMAGYRLIEPEMINDHNTLSRLLPVTPLLRDIKQIKDIIVAKEPALYLYFQSSDVSKKPNARHINIDALEISVSNLYKGKFFKASDTQKCTIEYKRTSEIDTFVVRIKVKNNYNFNDLYKKIRIYIRIDKKKDDMWKMHSYKYGFNDGKTGDKLIYASPKVDQYIDAYDKYTIYPVS